MGKYTICKWDYFAIQYIASRRVADPVSVKPLYVVSDDIKNPTIYVVGVLLNILNRR